MGKSENKDEIWMEAIWPGYHWYQGINPMYAYLEDIPRLGYKFSKMAVWYSKGTESFCFIKSEYENNGAEFFKVVRKNPKILFGILEKINGAAEEIFKLGKKWMDIDFSKCGNKELSKYHSGLFRWDKPLWRFGQIPNLLELYNSYLSDYVRSVIEKTFGGEDLNEIFGILTTSTYESVTMREERDFLFLLKAQQGKTADIRLSVHWKKYTWMTHGWAGPALPLEYFKKNFADAEHDTAIIPKIEKSILARKEIIGRQKVLLGKINFADGRLVILLRSILEAKARRVDAHSLTYYLAEKMMMEIGKRVGLTLEQMRVVAPDDVAGLFKKVDVAEINDEYNLVMYWYEESKLRKLTGSVAEEKMTYIKSRLPKVLESDEVNGSLAYAGKAQGTVRIILDVKDAGRLKAGDILVTRMTDPSYVPIMKIAGAIVTDVGGITCHAAIVARELKIPCIVGTKVATKILKDGMIVEVDAERGVVTIIQNGE